MTSRAGGAPDLAAARPPARAVRPAAPPIVDDARYDDLFAAHWRGLVRLARLLVDDVPSAEDVVQEAFLSLFRHRDALADPAAAPAYLRAAVVNRSRSVVRRRVTARRHLRVADPDEGPAADEPLVLAEEHREVLAALDRLPRRQQEVLVLRYWEGLGEAEIAALLGIAGVTVRATVSRALDALERTLRPPGPPSTSAPPHRPHRPHRPSRSDRGDRP